MLGFDNPIHILFLLAVLLLVFGAKRLPEMGRSLGTGMRDFRDALSGATTEPPALGEPVHASTATEASATTTGASERASA